MRSIALAVALAVAFAPQAGAQSSARGSQPSTAGAFDRAAAAAALGAVNIGSCKKTGGPTGAGKVTVTFAPNGTVSNAEIDGAPFAGTAVGGCIAAKYRGVHVAPFSGAAVTVAKSFSLS